MVALLPLLVSPATAQTVAPPPAVIASALASPAYMAETRCAAGRPVTTPLSDSALERHGLTRQENVRHEAAHWMQLAANCESVMAVWATNPSARMDAEVQATCIGIAWYPDATHRSRRRNDARTMLMMLFGPLIGPGAVYEAFERWCAT